MKIQDTNKKQANNSLEQVDTVVRDRCGIFWYSCMERRKKVIGEEESGGEFLGKKHNNR
jgi:hypothetical protein